MDLLDLTAELVDIPSVSFGEADLVARIETELRSVSDLVVYRVGDNLIARTELGRAQRLIVAGHTDTVPGDTAAGARIDGDTCWGLGSADMKGSLAVMLDLACSIPRPAIDVSWVFYAREEVAREHNGLLELFTKAPELLAGDAAVLGEPTGAEIEAGCQGTIRFEVVLAGTRAHSARPWMGRNAVHRLSGLLGTLDAYECREPIVGGCQFREALQAVRVEGGIAGNVVPDSVTLSINHRYAPDRSFVEAESHIRDLLAPHIEDADSIEVADQAPAAAPAIGHPLLAALSEGRSVKAKFGWTDVAFFAEQGIPAVNFGPGNPALAHTSQERVERSSLETTHRALWGLLEE